MKRHVLSVAVLGLAGTGLLIGLGVWQLQRLSWKEALILRLEARLAAEPVPLPERPTPEADAFRRVSVEGQVGGAELHLLTSLPSRGPGFRVIAPIETAAGRRILVDLGYVPEAQRNMPRLPASGQVTGALYWPDEVDRFTPPPDTGANIWFARDLPAMAAALGTEPLLIVAESHPMGAAPQVLPLGENLPNDHLQYAITWFTLALAWAVMSAMLARRQHRGADGI